MLSSPQPPSSSPSKQSSGSAFVNGIRCIWFYLAKEVDDPNAERKADALLVAASVIAAMNFQAAISPPGGAYQDTRTFANGSIEYQAGQSIVAYVAPFEFKRFSIANTVSFTFSMTTMFLFLSGLSLKRRIFSFLLTASMFATITATTYSYKWAMEATTPDHDDNGVLTMEYELVSRLLIAALVIWFVLAGIAITVFFWKLLKVPVTTAYRRATVKA